MAAGQAGHQLLRRAYMPQMLPRLALLLARPYRNVDRGTGEVELLAQPALHEPDIAGVELPSGEQHEPGRTGTRLRGEQHPRRLATTYRVRGGLHQRGQPLVEPAGRYPPGP